MSCEDIKTRVDRMLEIPNAEGEDITDGSPYKILATMFAIESKEECENNEEQLDNAFASTANEEYLERIGEDIGQPRIEATESSGELSITGTQGRVINPGDKAFRSTDNFTYTIIDGGTIGLIPLVVNITADETGDIGNSTVGTIDRLEDMTGISLVSNDESITNGTDVEDLEVYRTRVINFIQRPRRSGNAAHFEEWAEEVEGVFRAKSFPVWNGDGTVKVTAIDEDSLPITEAKRIEMDEYITSQMPISAILTTTIPSELDIDSVMDVILSDGWDLATATIEIEAAIDKYLKEDIAFIEDIISYLDFSCVLVNTESIKSLITLTLNGGTSNIAIPAESVATRGATTITEV